MPTGYTAKIADDITFNEFVMDCTRAMGVCVTMRDDPNGGECIPEKFKPSTYHLEEMRRYQDKLNEFNSLTVEEAEKRSIAEAERRLVDTETSESHRKQLKVKYEAMLKKVNGWEPPTKEHNGLQNFMVQQITESIKFDCTTYDYGHTERLPGAEWLASRIESIAESIEYHAKEYAAEVKRAATRNLWLSQLRDSLKEK